MKKILISIIAVVFVAALVVFFGGFYPVVTVDGVFVTRRVFVTAQKAGENFANAEFQKAGMHPVDFASSDNATLLRDIRKGVTTFLIEDRILEEKGTSVVEGFDSKVRGRVDEVLKNNSNSGQIAQQVYGLSLEDFRTFVLEPQARRDVIAEALKANNQDFFNWLSEQKKKTSVRIFFMGFGWDGEKAN